MIYQTAQPMTKKKLFIIAGEASGDLLGADFLQSLGDDIKNYDIQGIGGDEMLANGLPSSIFPMDDLAVMGIMAVLPRLPLLLKRISQTVQAIVDFQPDVLLTIDAPDFNFRVAKAVRKKGLKTKLIHYVAPTVWAWRPKRAEKIARFLDEIWCLFPFEPPYFDKHGLKAKFVGHPLAKKIQSISDADKTLFRQKYGLQPDKPTLCLLPGSRHREIDTLLPIFLRTVTVLRQQFPALQVILPTLPTRQKAIMAHLSDQDDIIIVTSEAEKYRAMQIADVALHASGTVGLELGLCETPMVTAYKVPKMTEWIMRLLLNINHINLVNIILGKPIVVERVQTQCHPDILAKDVMVLLANKKSQVDDLKKLKAHLLSQTGIL